MAEYNGELKLIKKTVRMSETMVDKIEAFSGEDFSDKLRNLVDYCFEKVPAINQDMYSLLNEVDKLQKERQQLMDDIAMLRDARGKVSELLQTFDELQKDFAGEMITKAHKNIALMIEKDGFRATPKVVEQIRQLNERTGKRHSLGDICRAYKQNTYGTGVNTADMESQKLVNEIYKEFQCQELERQPMEMEVEQ